MSYSGQSYSLVSTRQSRTSAGLSTIRTWEGTADGINGVIATLTAWDTWDIDDSEAPKYRLTVRSPDAVDPESASIEYAWELVGSEVQKDMFEHPTVKYWSQDDTGKDLLRQIKAAIKDDESPDFLSVQGPALPQPTTQESVMAILYDRVLKGQTHWLWPHYSLRFTATVGPTFSGGIDDDGSMAVWTSSQIVSQYSNFPMYSRTQARTLALQEKDPTAILGAPGAAEGFTWGWLKKPQTEAMMPDWKIRISTEWELELWDTRLTYAIWT